MVRPVPEAVSGARGRRAHLAAPPGRRGRRLHSDSRAGAAIMARRRRNQTRPHRRHRRSHSAPSDSGGGEPARYRSGRHARVPGRRLMPLLSLDRVCLSADQCVRELPSETVALVCHATRPARGGSRLVQVRIPRHVSAGRQPRRFKKPSITAANCATAPSASSGPPSVRKSGVASRSERNSWSVSVPRQSAVATSSPTPRPRSPDSIRLSADGSSPDGGRRRRRGPLQVDRRRSHRAQRGNSTASASAKRGSSGDRISSSRASSSETSNVGALGAERRKTSTPSAAVSTSHSSRSPWRS